MAINRLAVEAAVRELLVALGRDREDPLVAKTPERVAEAYENDLLAGERIDVRALIEAESEAASGEGIVVLSDLAVATVCPHHLLPGVGRATVAYEPGPRLLGIGALGRVVDACARRLALQESIGESVVRALALHAGARGAYCELSLLHTCLAARGSRQAGATVHTVATSGTLATPEGQARVALALGRRAPDAS